MVNKIECPICGKYKKAWFSLCWECTEKENQKPTCDVCNKDVPEGHNLCKTHWSEKKAAEKNINQVKYIHKKKEETFKEKFEGKYYFNSQKMKSKSELLICYFLTANQINFSYEPKLNIGNGLRPDFVIDDGKGNSIILEHFGMDYKKELKIKNENKKELYDDLCEKEEKFYFIFTTEEDLYDLRENLGSKLNDTPLKRILWK